MQFLVKRKRKMKAKTTQTFMWNNMIILPLFIKKKKNLTHLCMHEATKLETNITFLLK